MVQGAIYNSIDKELADFLHDRGYTAGNRSFKLFSFSRLNGPFHIKKENNIISFTGKMKLVISSPVDEYCQSLVNSLLTRGFMRLGSFEVGVEKVFAKKMKVNGGDVRLKTTSPVVLYSTLLRPDGRKYTCYFQPGEPDYNRLLEDNLRKKYRAFFGDEPPEGEFRVKTLGRQKMHIVDYKGTIIKGYSGKLLLTGPDSLLQIALDAGVGGKNSQGFGCVEMVEKNSL